MAGHLGALHAYFFKAARPLTVSRYFCRRLLGLQGMVRSTSFFDRSELTTACIWPSLCFRPAFCAKADFESDSAVSACKILAISDCTCDRNSERRHGDPPSPEGCGGHGMPPFYQTGRSDERPRAARLSSRAVRASARSSPFRTPALPPGAPPGWRCSSTR